VIESVTLDIKVIPRAGRTELAGTRDGAILIRLAAAPVEGAANHALVAFLAEVLDVAKRDITIVSGETGRLKRVKILGITAGDAQERLDRRSHRRAR
jgi:uncharacterized protein (TIGR00251 family)